MLLLVITYASVARFTIYQSVIAWPLLDSASRFGCAMRSTSSIAGRFAVAAAVPRSISSPVISCWTTKSVVVCHLIAAVVLEISTPFIT